MMRRPRDWFFQKRYAHHALVLETIAGIPGMVGGMLLHLSCLRRIRDDQGWIQKLLDEAHNEYKHLMTFHAIAEPTFIEQIFIRLGQSLFFIGYFLVYVIYPPIAHRFVGYLEEEAVISYKEYLEYLKENPAEDIAAPRIAHEYWELGQKARLSDVICVIISEEEEHRDVNHQYASLLKKDKRKSKKGKNLRELD